MEKASDTRAWLIDEMITVDEWEEGIRDHLIAQKLAKFLFDKEVEKFFVQHRLDYEQILLYQIVVPYEKVAQELFYQIAEKEISFYEAAHLYDIDEKRRHLCGYEGKLYLRSLRPDLAAMISSTKPGEVIGPVKTDLGYHLFKVEEFISAELTPQINQEIISNMFKEWLASELNYIMHSKTD